MKFETHSEEETVALGRRLAREFPDGAVVLLEGNLGAGKTTLAKGLVSGLNAAPAAEVTSPTFTLIHEYDAGVFHVDLYRLEQRREVEGLGLDEIFGRARLVLIEWGERFRELMPPGYFEVKIRHAGGDSREIEVSRVSG